MGDVAGRSTSLAVLERVAAEEGVDVNDLDPLYAYVEPDALDALCDHGFDGRFTFEYAGYEVTVYGDGRIDID